MAVLMEKGLTPWVWVFWLENFSGATGMLGRGVVCLYSRFSGGFQSSREVWMLLESCSSLGARVGGEKTMGSAMPFALCHRRRSAHPSCHRIPPAQNWVRKWGSCWVEELPWVFGGDGSLLGGKPAHACSSTSPRGRSCGVCATFPRCYGFAWQGFGSGWAIGVASARSFPHVS